MSRTTKELHGDQPAINVDADVHQVLAAGELVLAATAWGMAASRDGGASWEFDDAGLHASYSRAVAVCGDYLLISASEGPFRGRAAVYRKKLGSTDSFEKCREGLPEWFTGNVDTHSLAADGATVAFVSEDGHLFTSEDAGHRWSKVAEGLPEPSAVVVRGIDNLLSNDRASAERKGAGPVAEAHLRR